HRRALGPRPGGRVRACFRAVDAHGRRRLLDRGHRRLAGRRHTDHPLLPESQPDRMVLRKDRAAAMPFIMTTTLIDMVSIGLIIPVLPALVGSFTGSQTDQAFWYGVVTFAFGFANFFASPILGALSDGHGRRPVLLLGFCGLALSFLLTALATSLAMLVAIRVLSGAMQANMSVSNAYVADITPPQERTKRFGMLGAMFGIGFILGPVM